MKRLSALFACLLSVGASWSQTGNWTDEGNYDTSWYDGNNSGEYHISTPQQLAGWAYLASQGNRMSPNRIVLDNDLDLSAHYWTPIKEFAGFLDGNGKTLSGVHIEASADAEEIGFIARLSQYYTSTYGIVYNLNMDETCQIASSNRKTDVTLGSFVGYAGNNTTIAGCRFLGNITVERVGDLQAGGIVGRSLGTVARCTNEGDLTFNLNGAANASCGGITGGDYFTDNHITGCVNKGVILSNITANDKGEPQHGPGWACGFNRNKSLITNCAKGGRVGDWDTYKDNPSAAPEASNDNAVCYMSADRYDPSLNN